MSTVESDHCMVVTELQRYNQQRFAGRRVFRYENVWQTHGDYDRVVRDLWN